MYISVRLEISHIFPYLQSMYIATIPNRSSPPAILLRESYRQDGKVKTRTLANLTHWPPAQLEALRRVLRGDTSWPQRTPSRSSAVSLMAMSLPSWGPCDGWA